MNGKGGRVERWAREGMGGVRMCRCGEGEGGSVYGYLALQFPPQNPIKGEFLPKCKNKWYFLISLHEFLRLSECIKEMHKLKLISMNF